MEVFSCYAEGLPITFSWNWFYPVYFYPTNLFEIELNWVPIAKP
jgi:hypothetical protein